MLEDVASGRLDDRPRHGRSAILDLLTSRKIEYVTFDDWKAIEAAEIERGKRRGAPRLKFNRVSRMLTAAKKKGESPLRRHATPHLMTSRFDSAIRKIDEANAEDPRHEVCEGRQVPKELLYGKRMSQWLQQVAPEASEALRLAARAQHLCRWEVPRSDYPMDRTGYLKWRTFLYSYHADKAARILEEVGYGPETIERVKVLLRKRNLRDADVQALEDAVCLVFLEYELEAFAQKHDEVKLISIIQKTWKKMSSTGQEFAAKLSLSPDVAALLEKAIE
jgi:hypothetical protein